MVEPNGVEPLTSCVQGRRSTNWAMAPCKMVGLSGLEPLTPALSTRCSNQLSYRPNYACYKRKLKLKNNLLWILADRMPSIRRWSSRRFPYGYLVTTSPQSSTTPWWTPSRRLSYPLLVQSTPMVWRAVCTRPGNVFTAAFWSAITSDSYFMESSCRLQSGLR